MATRRALGGALLALVSALFMLLPASARAEGDPVHGLWRVTAGPGQAGDNCTFKRQTWFAQIANYAPGSWFQIWNSYAEHEVTESKVTAGFIAQYTAESWTDPPPQAVIDQINAAQIPIAFEGKLSADRRLLTGTETYLCLYWDQQGFNGHQLVRLPVRAERVTYLYAPVRPDGTALQEVKLGEKFYIVVDTEEHLGWDEAWIYVWDSDPKLWIPMAPDEANSRYLSPALTVSKPLELHLDLPKEAMAGRLYAEPGAKVQFVLHPSLNTTAVTVVAEQP